MFEIVSKFGIAAHNDDESNKIVAGNEGISAQLLSSFLQIHFSLSNLQMCKLNKFHGKVNISSLSIETALNFDDLIQV